MEIGTSLVRHDWTRAEIMNIMAMPMMDLLFTAQKIHRQHFAPNEVQKSQLLSIKTGACPEDSGYCSQSGHHKTEVEKEKLLALQKVVEQAKLAKAQGASRFCMGAAWRGPRDKDFSQVIHMIKEVKALGLETCATLGMLSAEQAEQLAAAGLDYYNHNLDTSPEHYPNIVSTHSFADRLDTIAKVQQNNIKVCSGGILGMGESREDRVGLIHSFATLSRHPESVPINMLIPIKGTPLEEQKELDKFEFVRTIATARIVLPKSFVRLSAGRTRMSEELQTLCYFAGANSIFLGEKLLTAANPEVAADEDLFAKLGLKTLDLEVHYQTTEAVNA